ncbi:MAG: MBL fold metallo-hydrolase [Spirochaetaceae bacterium]
MEDKMKFTILGSGTSTGVPVIGCRCPVCTSDDPRDHRTRASLWLQAEGLSILFDTCTEFRIQALKAGIRRIDAVFLTHAHADHVHGLDDLRPLTHRVPIPVYGSPGTLGEIEERFSYIFEHSPVGGGKPKISLHAIDSAVFPGSSDLEVIPVPVYHGNLMVYGYRVGAFAYLTDCNRIPKESYPLLEGVEVMVIDALRFRSHPTHFNIAQAVEAVKRVGAKRAYCTHLGHELSYRELLHALPEGIFPAYDGLTHTF